MRVFVIGGGGFLGAKTVKALRSRGVDVWIGGRRPRPTSWMRIDVQDPETFASMDRFDVIVNCSDSIRAAPDAVVEYCLRKGLILIETSGDRETIERIFLKFRAEENKGVARNRGCAILGMGLFPGLSNIVAREAYESTRECGRLDVAIRVNPLSGAGRGVCALMSKLVVTKTSRYENGALIEDPPVVSGPKVRSSATARKTSRVGLPEAVMLHWSTGVPNTGALLTVPALVRFMLRLTGIVASTFPKLRRYIATLLELSLIGIRSILLKQKPTEVEIMAIAKPGSRGLSLRVSDGMTTTACLIAASTEMIFGKKETVSGLYLPDEIFGLQDLLKVVDAELCEVSDAVVRE